jgi:hypothetical protein
MLVTTAEPTYYYLLWNVVYRHSSNLPCYNSTALYDGCRQKSCLMAALLVGDRFTSRVRESVSRSLLVTAVESCVLPVNRCVTYLVCLSVYSIRRLLEKKSYMHRRRYLS